MDKYRILVVDDELLIRDLLYDFFITQDWDITVAEDGQKAIDCLKNREFDIVLTDLKMPDIDGMDLTGRIRNLYGDLPVVIMTGYPSLDSALEALRHKVDDYIIKPFNVNQLFKVVKKAVESGRKKEAADTE
jgi:DNA-binding NtrC family response regulator